MTYEQALNYIHSRLRFGMKTGLDRIERLCELLDNPQDKLKAIHVAGTNGKGSTCAMLARVLQTAGYKVGLFISPYITDFCERMQIREQPISHDQLAEITEQVKEAADKMEKEGLYATEFEIVTAIAFKWFEQSKCQYVVIETGLGGRLDSTNVIKNPLETIITSIDFDHTDILGDTIESIAMEKCGIIKQNGITVVYPKQNEKALDIILKTAAKKNNSVCIPSIDDCKIFSSDIHGTRFCYKDEIYNLALAGEHQIYNALTVIEAANALKKIGVDIGQNDIEHAVLHVKFPCRFEVMSEDPIIIIDGAHNPSAMHQLKNTLQKLLPDKNIHAVIGMLADKNYVQSMSIIAPLCKSIITVDINNPRALKKEELCKYVSQYCVCSYENDYKDAVNKSIAKAKEDNGIVLICGSLYLASDIRPIISKNDKNEHTIIN